MKLSCIVPFLATLASALPTATSDEDLIVERSNIVKRATITDVATTGYATQNGGTTGGKGGTVTTVSTLAQFTAAVTNDVVPRIIVVKGTITGPFDSRVGSNKSIIGLKGARLVGIGLYIQKATNVIVRNIISESVLAAYGDAIAIQASKNVWVDHVELFSAATTDGDKYDGLFDVSHASEWVTLSNSYIHDHHKNSLIGHSDNNGAEDTGHLHVTQHNNYWLNTSERTPSVRFGTVHVYNSYFKTGSSGINSRMGAQVLVQSNVFEAVTKPITSENSKTVGYVSAFDNNLGGAANTAPLGTLTPSSVPYTYSLLGSANVKAAVVGVAGATLTL